MNYVKIDRYMTLYLMILIINSVTHVIQAFYPDNYLGCFVDHGYLTDRLLPFRQPDSDNNSRKRCEDACREDGYTLAGTESTEECFCGNEMKDYEKVSETECDEKCPGNEDEFCGGDWRISIYNITELIHQSTSTIQTTEVTSVSDIVHTKTTATETEETTVTTSTLHTNELLDKTTKQLNNLNAKTLTIYIILPAAVVVIAVAIIAKVLLKRRQNKKFVSKMVYDAAGSSNDIYENDADVVKESNEQVAERNEENQQYSLVSKRVHVEAADDDYNILNLKTSSNSSSELCHNFTSTQDRTLLDHTYSHISNSESCPNAFIDTYSHFEPNSPKALSTMEESYDRL